MISILGMRSRKGESMRSTALAFKDDDDEVPMSSTEVLEANVAAIRVDLNELKTDFRAAVARIDGEIKSAVTKLEADIRASAANARKDLELFADRVQTQLSELRADISELRADNKALGERIDSMGESLGGRIDTLGGRVDSLRDKVDSNFSETNKAISDLSKIVLKIDSRLSAIPWVCGGLIALVTLTITVGKALEWF
jgi:chromosome segregation ATPase